MSSIPQGVTRQQLVDELAELLVVGRQDPSDPEDCFTYLLAQGQYRWRTLHEVFDDVIAAAGQIYIAREISRRAA